MGKSKVEDDNILRDEELRLWERAMRDARPLKRRELLRSTKLPPERSNERTPRLAGRRAAPTLGSRDPAELLIQPELAVGRTPGVDARTAERLRRGEIPIEARLDLHGYTQEEAHRALLAFVETAWRRHLRCLLVITGKGRGQSPDADRGVLKTSVPRWFNGPPLRSRVLAFAFAQPKDGGSGALYVLLRRQR